MHCIYIINQLQPRKTRQQQQERELPMNLQTAQAMLLQDRMDWRKPHLKWVSERFYRFFSNMRN